MTMTWQVLLLLHAVLFDKISANEYAACYYDSNWWAGLVQNVNCDEKDVEINFHTLQDPQTTLLGQREKTFVGCHIWIRPPTTLTGQTYYLEKEGNEMIPKLLN